MNLLKRLPFICVLVLMSLPNTLWAKRSCTISGNRVCLKTSSRSKGRGPRADSECKVYPTKVQAKGAMRFCVDKGRFPNPIGVGELPLLTEGSSVDTSPQDGLDTQEVEATQ